MHTHQSIKHEVTFVESIVDNMKEVCGPHGMTRASCLCPAWTCARVQRQCLYSVFTQCIAALSCHPDSLQWGLIPGTLWTGTTRASQVAGRGRNLDPPVADEAFRYASLNEIVTP